MTKPWVRLYRREEGTFAQLPLYVRALAGELLKLTDDEGTIRIGRREPWEAIAYALGATRSDRRLLKGHVQLLLDDGYLRHEGQVIVVANFPRFQADATEPRPPNDRTTTGQRCDHDRAATDPPSDHDGATKEEGSARNHNRALRADQSREEQIRQDPPPSGRGEAHAPRGSADGTPTSAEPAPPEPSYDPLLGVPPPSGASPEPDAPGHREVRQVLAVFERAWHAHTGRRLGLRQHAEHQRAVELWRWGLEERPAAPLEVIAEAAGCACADAKFRASKRPWLDFCGQPGRYLPARPGPHAARPESLCVQVFRRLWERRHGSTWEGPRPGNGDAPEVIDTWAVGAAHELGASPEAVITASIRRWSQDTWVQEHGFPWRAWAIGYAEAFRPEDLAPAEPVAAGGAPC